MGHKPKGKDFKCQSVDTLFNPRDTQDEFRTGWIIRTAREEKGFLRVGPCRPNPNVLKIEKGEISTDDQRRFTYIRFWCQQNCQSRFQPLLWELSVLLFWKNIKPLGWSTFRLQSILSVTGDSLASLSSIDRDFGACAVQILICTHKVVNTKKFHLRDEFIFLLQVGPRRYCEIGVMILALRLRYQIFQPQVCQQACQNHIFLPSNDMARALFSLGFCSCLTVSLSFLPGLQPSQSESNI
jgi:hypothetical protein